MTSARLSRASAACAALVKRPRALVWVAVVIVLSLEFSVCLSRASSPDRLQLSAPAFASLAGGDYRLSLALRAEPPDFLSLQGRARTFRLREFIEPSLPGTPPVRVGDEETREGWDWAGFRRQLVRALPGARKLRFERDCLGVESDRFNEPGRIPGVVQDAAIATGVRARLAGEPSLRSLPLEVQCREGRVRIRGSFPHCAETARAIVLALAVEGVREVRADLPGELQREMAADR